MNDEDDKYETGYSRPFGAGPKPSTNTSPGMLVSAFVNFKRGNNIVDEQGTQYIDKRRASQ
jgi:hypothetical protein